MILKTAPALAVLRERRKAQRLAIMDYSETVSELDSNVWNFDVQVEDTTTKLMVETLKWSI